MTGPQQPGLDADVADRFLLVPDVIAGRHHVDAVREQVVADLARDAEAAGGVLGVDDHEVDAVPAHNRVEPGAHQIAPGAPDDIADKQDVHA